MTTVPVSFKKYFLFISLFTVLAFSACEKDEDEEKITYTISATANGAQEIPAVATNGSGTVSGTYNKNTNVLEYTATWTGLSGNATNMHFHGPASPTESAGVAVGITGFTATPSGSVTNTVTLTEEQEEDMLAGLWYYNVHTAANAAGEIRGQVIAQ